MHANSPPNPIPDKSLGNQDEQFRLLMDCVKDHAILLLDPDGRVIGWNVGAERIFGYAAGDIRGQPFACFFTREDRERGEADNELRTALQRGQAQDDRWHVCQDGHRIWGSGTLTALHDAAGQLRGFAKVVRDLTEQRRMEEALRESEQRHRLIADLTSDYAYTCRVETDGSVFLESVTSGFTRVLGFTYEEMLAGGGWASIVHADDLPRLTQETQRLLAGEREVNEIRLLTKEGGIRWVRYSVQPIWDADHQRVVRLVGAAQDISERKLAEGKLQEYTERLRELSHRLLLVQEQERRHVARELHDAVGQSLTGLKLSLEMCSRAPVDQLLPSLGEALRQVQELTAQVRDLALRLRPTMLDDLGLQSALLWLFDRYTRQTEIRVLFQEDGLNYRFPPEVETAAYRIVQEALTNVARHARVREVRVRLWHDRERLSVQIEDAGVGFDLEKMLAARSSCGLSGMHERVQLLGGQFVVESAHGAGTRITAELLFHVHGVKEKDHHGFDFLAGR